MPHGLDHWSPSPSVALELVARRPSPPRQQSFGYAARGAAYAPLRFDERVAHQHNGVRLLDGPQRHAPVVVPRGHAAAGSGARVKNTSSGKLLISFPAGVAASRRLSARQSRLGRKSRASGSVATLTERTAAGLLMLEWKPSEAEPFPSPAPSAPETPGPSNSDGSRIDDNLADAQEPHLTTAAADASAVALPTPPTSQPAAPTLPSSLVGQMGPPSVLPQPSVPLQAALVERDASSPADTFYHPTAYRPVRGAPRLRQPRRGEATEACRRPECAEDGARAPHSWRGRCSQGTHYTSVRAIRLRVSPLCLRTPTGLMRV